LKYKKYEMGAYNLHVINTDKFKTVSIKINFKRKCVKDEITIRSLLTYLLLESNNLYKNRRMLEIKTEELYNLKYNAFNTISGNYNIMTFEASFLNEKYTQEGMLKESIKFLLDLILNPNVKDNKFSIKEFEMCKNLVEEQIETLKERVGTYSQIRMLEEMDSKSVISFRATGYIEDLEKITESNIYEYYKTILKSDIVDIFIIGNIDIVETKNIINDLFKINTLKKPSQSHEVIHTKIRNKVNIKKEKLDIEQSKLVMGFKLTNLTEFEKKYVMGVYSYILGGGPDSKLFKTVREKNSLCYSIGSNYSLVFNLFKINAGINNKDFKKTVSLIKKEMKNMSNGMFTEKEIKSAIMTYLSTYKEIQDNENSVLVNYITTEYLKIDPIEIRQKQIKKVTKEMIIEVSKKIHLDTIFLLEGNE